MKQTIYEDNKYSMQDVGNLYVGTKYTLGEIVETEELPFKFRLLAERYILPEAHPEDTLESNLYYLDSKSFLAKLYRQLKARVKINILEEKKSLTGKRGKQYVTRILSVEALAEMPLKEKEEKGVVVQELILSKLALASF